MGLIAGSTVLLHLPAALRHLVGSFNATVISLALIALLVRVVWRRSQLGVVVVVAVPALAAGLLAAVFVRRALGAYLAIVGGETAVVAAVAALGVALPRRHGASGS